MRNTDKLPFSGVFNGLALPVLRWAEKPAGPAFAADRRFDLTRCSHFLMTPAHLGKTSGVILQPWLPQAPGENPGCRIGGLPVDSAQFRLHS